MDTSREAYEAAAARYEAINGTIHQRRTELLDQLDALSGEWDDALDDLRRHEAYAGIPAWEHIEAGPGACRLGTRCRVHAAAAVFRLSSGVMPGSAQGPALGDAS